LTMSSRARRWASWTPSVASRDRSSSRTSRDSTCRATRNSPRRREEMRMGYRLARPDGPAGDRGRSALGRAQELEQQAPVDGGVFALDRLVERSGHRGLVRLLGGGQDGVSRLGRERGQLLADRGVLVSGERATAGQPREGGGQVVEVLGWGVVRRSGR